MGFGYGAGAYQQVRSRGGVEGANPHALITLLMDGALERIVQARGHMQRGEVAAKGESISRCIDILGGLRDSLDRKVDEQLVDRLDSLYEYMSRRLVQANLRNDLHTLDEVAKLLTQVRDSWAKVAPTPAGAPPRAVSA
jgi:flagellar protein FliS